MFALKNSAALVFFILTALVSSVANGQSNVEGQAYLKAGIKSLGEDKAELAVKQLTSAIESNNLSDKEVAVALFQRGLALRKSGQTGRAVIDLTNALYLKGLPASDQSKAYLERARAYEELGLSTRASADIQAASRTRKSDPTDQNDSVASAEVGAGIRGSLPEEFKTTVEKSDQKQAVASVSQKNQSKSSSSTFLPKWLSNIVNPSPKPAKVADAAPTKIANADWATDISEQKPSPQSTNSSVPISGNWQTDTQTQPEKAVAKAPAPAPISANWNTAVASQKKASNGGDSGQQAKPQQNETPAPSASSWSSSTEVNTSHASSGNYHLQLASVKSEDEVKQVWKRLDSRYGSLLGGQPRNIQRVDLGEAGTRYRIRIGPYASKNDSLALCNSLKSKGLNCLVVPN